MYEQNEDWSEEEGVEECTAFTKGLGVKVNAKCWDKMYGWCRAAKSECSGLGLVEKKGDIFTVKEVFLLEQVSGSAHTELDPQARAKLQAKLHKRGIPGSMLRFWWHTHYNFGVFWSGTDVDTATKLAGSSADWMLSMVINQKYKYKCRIDVFKPFRFAVDDIEIQVKRPVDKSIANQCRKEVKKKIKEPYYPSYPSTGGYGGPGGSHGNHGSYHNGYPQYGGWYESDKGREGIRSEGDYWDNYAKRHYDRHQNGGGKQKMLPMGAKYKGLPKDIPDQTGEDFYWKGGKRMMWVKDLNCYVEEGCENDATFQFGGKTVTRQQLKQLTGG